jgi:hypothetical protein
LDFSFLSFCFFKLRLILVQLINVITAVVKKIVAAKRIARATRAMVVLDVKPKLVCNKRNMHVFLESNGSLPFPSLFFFFFFFVLK